MSIVENRKRCTTNDRGALRAGLVLEGWEVKAIRPARPAQGGLRDRASAELFLIGAHITALPEASTPSSPIGAHPQVAAARRGDPQADRKVERAGYTLVPLDMHYSRGA